MRENLKKFSREDLEHMIYVLNEALLRAADDSFLAQDLLEEEGLTIEMLEALSFDVE